MLADKNILITGGAGSVGSYLVPKLLDRDPSVVRIFDNNEPSLTATKHALEDDRCRFLAGDIRDQDRLSRAMQDIDVVVHTAAMKHVDIAEYNPFEAVKTNVLGLQNVVDVAIDTSSVDEVLFTSSDKAVNPANTMGTTKLLGEKLITAGNKYRGPRNLSLSSVRFGNVVNSSQSVVPVFKDQIEDGGPVTVTDTRMTRFFLTYEDIGDLILAALDGMVGGEVFIYKMSAIRIEDLATAMIAEFAPEFGYDPADIETEIVGKRVGETLHEEIMTEREADRAYENDSLYVIPPETVEDNGYLSYDVGESFQPIDDVVRSSHQAPKLGVEKIAELLRRSGATRAVE